MHNLQLAVYAFHVYNMHGRHKIQSYSVDEKLTTLTDTQTRSYKIT